MTSKPTRASRGFSLVELLSVLAVVAVLAAFLLPALARARARALGVACLSNVRQLMLGWSLYPEDNADWLSPSAAGADAGQHAGNPGWVSGWVGWARNPGFDDGRTNTAVLVEPGPGKIGPYCHNPALYKCPADRSSADRPFSDGAPTRVRSYSVNSWIGVSQGGTPPFAVTFRKTSDFRRVSPGEIFVAIEEHPWTIDDGLFEVEYGLSVESAGWGDFPAMRHGTRTPVGFADGHVESHRWSDPRTKPETVAGRALPEFVPTPGSPDFRWLAGRTSIPAD